MPRDHRGSCFCANDCGRHNSDQSQSCSRSAVQVLPLHMRTPSVGSSGSALKSSGDLRQAFFEYVTKVALWWTSFATTLDLQQNKPFKVNRTRNSMVLLRIRYWRMNLIPNQILFATFHASLQSKTNSPEVAGAVMDAPYVGRTVRFRIARLPARRETTGVVDFVPMIVAAIIPPMLRRVAGCTQEHSVGSSVV